MLGLNEESSLPYFFDIVHYERIKISSLVGVPDTSVAAVEGVGVGDIEVSHEFAEVAKRGFHQKMEMIAHDDIGIKLDGIDIERRGENAKKFYPIPIILEDVLPFIFPARYVINCSGITPLIPLLLQSVLGGRFH